MKTITLDLPDAVYRDLQEIARAKTSSITDYLVEALASWKPVQHGAKMSLRDRRAPFNAGGRVEALTADDDLLEEMRDDSRS
jgi:predicted transcriptional regulator